MSSFFDSVRKWWNSDDPPVAGDRASRDADAARRYLPANTRSNPVGGTTYWTFDIVNKFGVVFTLTCYFDGQQYQVKVLQPAVEGRYGVHDGHLYPDGRICLSQRGGADTLQEAYAKSVIWATGFTVLESTGRFPFSLNNQ